MQPPESASADRGKPVYVILGTAGFVACLIGVIVLHFLGEGFYRDCAGALGALFGFIYGATSLFRREGCETWALALMMAAVLLIAGRAGWSVYESVQMDSELRSTSLPS